MEAQLGSLGLVLNAVFWTTRYIDAAVTQLRAEDHEIRDEDIAPLSPLRHRNLNVLGRYSSAASTPAAGARARCATRTPGATTRGRCGLMASGADQTPISWRARWSAASRLWWSAPQGTATA